MNRSAVTRRFTPDASDGTNMVYLRFGVGSDWYIFWFADRTAEGVAWFTVDSAGTECWRVRLDVAFLAATALLGVLSAA